MQNGAQQAEPEGIFADMADFSHREDVFEPLKLTGPSLSRKPGAGEHSSQCGAVRTPWEGAPSPLEAKDGWSLD